MGSDVFMNRLLSTVVSVPLIVSLAACNANGSKEGDSVQQVQENKDPVTLNVLNTLPGLSDEEFQKLIAEPVKAKKPNITLNMFRLEKGQTMEDLITAGQIPDMIYTGPYIRAAFIDTEVALDLSSHLKKYNIDISGLEPTILQAIKDYDEKGAIYSLPFTKSTYALWYNKGIFDKFGVAYPKDGMTWDDAIGLAKQLTRQVDGVQYYGLGAVNNEIRIFGAPLSLEVIDPKTNSPIFSPQWKNVFDKAMEIYGIQGNKPQVLTNALLDPFLKDKNVAMAAYWTAGMMAGLPNAVNSGLEWDVVQIPTFAEAPGKNMQPDYHQFIVSGVSKHIDAAVEVLKITLSEEVQTKATRLGKLTTLNNSAITEQFGADLPFAKGKNLQGILKGTNAKMVVQTDYNRFVWGALNRSFRTVYDGKQDVNSALRQAEEEAAKLIAAEKERKQQK
jgi:multiple sugar transport system substrate-binding protein